MTGDRAYLADDIDGDVPTEAECRAFLAARTFGRVGTTSRGLPVIAPVRYSYGDGAITFRAGTGSTLRAVEDGDVLAFEVDAHDPETHVGWSVLVVGRATRSTGDSLQLRCEIVSGERFP